MAITYIYALASVLTVSLVSLIGIFSLSVKESLLKKYIFVFVSLAVGALLGDAFIHIIPEASSNISSPLILSLFLIGGILIFFLLERFMHWHHHVGIDDIDHGSKTTGKMIIISDSLHNFIDGIIIGTSYLVGVELGIATTIAVILHEIPQEIGDFGVLINSGYTKIKALWWNFLSSLLSVVGVIIAIILGDNSEMLAALFLPIAAGGFIYVALSDLIPELHRTNTARDSVIQFIGIILGVVAMAVLTILE